MVHQESQGIPMFSTAETIEKLLVLIDGERGRFFFMKRTAGGIINALFFNRHTTANQVDNVDSV